CARQLLHRNTRANAHWTTQGGWAALGAGYLLRHVPFEINKLGRRWGGLPSVHPRALRAQGCAIRTILVRSPHHISAKLPRATLLPVEGADCLLGSASWAYGPRSGPDRAKSNPRPAGRGVRSEPERSHRKAAATPYSQRI